MLASVSVTNKIKGAIMRIVPRSSQIALGVYLRSINFRREAVMGFVNKQILWIVIDSRLGSIQLAPSQSCLK